MLVLVVSFCFVLLFKKKKQGKEKAKEQFKCSSRRWVRDDVKLNKKKKNGLDYLQKDDFNGKLRKISNHLKFIYSTQ